MAEDYHAAITETMQDWLSAYGRLHGQGMAQPETTRLYADQHPAWWWGTTAQERANGQADAVPLGDLADPVSQLSMFVARPLLQGLQAFTAPPTPGSTLRGLGQGARRSPLSLVRGERGNLGPPPVSPEGEPLPGSVVRDSEGHLTRLYHSTPHGGFPDFDPAFYGTGEGSDLYGPGVYMMDNPAVSNRRYSGMGTLQEAERKSAAARQQLEGMAPNHPFRDDYERSLARWTQVAEETRPTTRPVYADLKKPFDADTGALDPQAVAKSAQEVLDAWGETGNAQAQTLLRKTRGRTTPITYEEMADWIGKEQTNRLLQRQGYDGITHIGGRARNEPHRAYIAFSPDQVYPSFNVDALPTRTPLRLR